jgi:hypothetical protein
VFACGDWAAVRSRRISRDIAGQNAYNPEYCDHVHRHIDAIGLFSLFETRAYLSCIGTATVE